ncbi:MAG: replication-associated recombination protein A, partial [Rhodothermales bacterium]
NSSMSYFSALEHVRNETSGEVPNHLKDANRDSEGLGHGKGYKYPHAFREHYVPQQYLPSSMQGTYFYDPGKEGYEEEVRHRLEEQRRRDAEENLARRVRRYAEDDD